MAREVLWKCIELHDNRNSKPDLDEPLPERERLSRFVLNLCKKLKAKEILLAPTDKTNRHITMHVDECKDKMFGTLQKISYPIDIKSIKAFKLQAE